MKPHIRLIGGIYYCGYRAGTAFRNPLGMGWTPKQAYEAWEKAQR